ncbi:MAG: hypothetical protein OEQ28_14495 [Acidobacteriota bacterium]|nr:hypothetical protein [Acidobacteriota bacterium]
MNTKLLLRLPLLNPMLFLAALALSFQSVMLYAETAPAANPANGEPFPVFHLSRGYSKGSTVDPRSVTYGSEGPWRTRASLIFTSRAYNNAIYSYPQPTADVVSENPQIICVSGAYDPAIYSYPYTGVSGKVYLIGPELLEDGEDISLAVP